MTGNDLQASKVFSKLELLYFLNLLSPSSKPPLHPTHLFYQLFRPHTLTKNI